VSAGNSIVAAQQNVQRKGKNANTVELLAGKPNSDTQRYYEKTRFKKIAESIKNMNRNGITQENKTKWDHTTAN